MTPRRRPPAVPFRQAPKFPCAAPTPSRHPEGALLMSRDFSRLVDLTRRPRARRAVPALEALECRVVPAPVVLQPDLALAKAGTVTQGGPAQLDFGPDGRLYASLANTAAGSASVVSFAYDAASGSLSG